MSRAYVQLVEDEAVFLQQNGYPVRKCSKYHLQVARQPFTFNIYPTKSTVYVNGMTEGISYSTKARLLEILQLQNIQATKTKRKHHSNKSLRVKLYLQSNTCCICKKPITSIDEATIDHKIPLDKGGSNRRDNKQLTHRQCNFKKGNKIEVDFKSTLE